MEPENGVEAAEVIEENVLVVRCDGSLQLESNFDQWREMSLQVIAGFNLSPATAEQCGKAKEDAKKCKAAEDAIEKAIVEILEQNAEINRIITGAREVQGKFAKSRTIMLKAADAFVVKQKETLMAEAIETVLKAVQTSPVAHAFRVDTAAIRACIKGKSSETVIRKELAAEADRQIAQLRELETLYADNMKLIETADAEYPGIAPDRKQLALKNGEVVEATLEARKANAEAAKTRKAAEEQAEAARVAAKEEADRLAAEKEAAQEASAAQVVPEQAPAFAELDVSATTEPELSQGFADLELPVKADVEQVPVFAGLEIPAEPCCRIMIDLDCSQLEAQPLIEYLWKLKHVAAVQVVQPREM